MKVELGLLEHLSQKVEEMASPWQTHCMPMTEYPGLQTQELLLQTELATDAHWLEGTIPHLLPS